MGKQNGNALALALCVVLVVGIFVSLFFVWPQYRVWQRGLAGEAELKQAEWNRQILIKEAEAKEQAAKAWARAEVERAKGAAEANAILAESLGGPEGYLRWLFIDRLDEMKGQVIYLPTEAGIPILEAGKR